MVPSFELIEREFYDRVYPGGIVEISWTKNNGTDFFRLARCYKNSANAVFREVIYGEKDNAKYDDWFLAAAFSMRQAVELILKAAVCKKRSNQEIQKCFQGDRHNLWKIFQRCMRLYGGRMPDDRRTWLETFCFSASRWDSSSDLLRYPMEGDLGELSNYFAIDIVETANLLNQAYELAGDFYGDFIDRCSFDKTMASDFLAFTERGIDNCVINTSKLSGRYYAAADGFAGMAYCLMENCAELKTEEKAFPVLFCLRHAIEVSLKHLSCKRGVLGVKGRAGHSLKKLWEFSEEKLRAIAEESGWDIHLLDIAGGQIKELGSIDKQGYIFRYPCSKSQEYEFIGKSVDLKSIYEYQMGLYCFLDGCNGCLDYEFEQESEWRDF